MMILYQWPLSEATRWGQLIMMGHIGPGELILSNPISAGQRAPEYLERDGI